VAGRTRTTLFYKFNVSGSSYSGEYFDPADFAQCTPQAAQSTLPSVDLLWLCADPDMGVEKLRLLEPPNARYSGSSEALARL